MATVRPISSLINRASSSTSALRSTSARWPTVRLANSSARARPIPPEAPVISAILPSIFMRHLLRLELLGARVSLRQLESLGQVAVARQCDYCADAQCTYPHQNLSAIIAIRAALAHIAVQI